MVRMIDDSAQESSVGSTPNHIVQPRLAIEEEQKEEEEEEGELEEVLEAVEQVEDDESIKLG